jgi:hypothetical protein
VFVAGVAGLIGLSVFFQTMYRGGYPHQGLLLVYLVALYWILLESADVGALRMLERAVFRLGFYGAMVLMLVAQVANAKQIVELDLEREASSSRAFGRFLQSSDEYRNAILVAEPDYLVESIPYYANNSIYIAREHRFGATVQFTTAADRSESLGELLETARRLKAENGRPVLIIFGHTGLDGASGEKSFSYNKILTWTPQDVQAFDDGVVMVAGYSSAYLDENYNVYEVR